MATTNRIQILLDAKNNASGALKAAQSELSGLGKAASGLVPGLNSVIAGFTALGVAAGALKLAQVAFDMGRATSESLRLAGAFDTLTRQAGQSSDAMLAAMRKASRGMVDDTTLIAAANRAMLLGVADTAEEMSQLLEVATARGKAMGLSTAQAFGDIVTGIGRMSPMILDNLGIVVDAAKANEIYAQSIGKTADKLTETEKKQALVNAVIASSSGLLAENATKGRDLAGSFERMDASIANAKDALGELFAPAAAAIAERLADAVDKMLDSMAEGKINTAKANLFSLGDSIAGVAEELDRQITKMQDAGLAGNFEAMRAAANHAEMLQIAIAELGAEYNAAAAITGAPLLDLALLSGGVVALKELSSAVSDMGDASADAAAEADALAQRLSALTSVAAAAASSIKASFTSAISNLGVGGALAGYQEASQQLKIQSELWKQQGLSVDEIEFRTAAFVNQIRTANSELGKTVTQTAKIPEYIKEAERADKLSGQISGLINQSLDIGVGVDPESFLPREDAINEDARRLADVMVNGFASPWAAYFEKEFPSLWADLASGGDIQQSAARVLQEFQRGLRPELMDREAIKARIRQMLIGDENTQRLASEIAQELSDELGISLQQANSAARSVLGAGGDENTAGDAFGGGFVGGVKDGNYGAQAVEVLVAQLDGNEAKLKTAGGRHARWYGGNFLEVFGGSVPNGVLDILVDLITPGVLARIAGLQTQTGTVD